MLVDTIGPLGCPQRLCKRNATQHPVPLREKKKPAAELRKCCAIVPQRPSSAISKEASGRALHATVAWGPPPPCLTSASTGASPPPPPPSRHRARLATASCAAVPPPLLATASAAPPPRHRAAPPPPHQPTTVPRLHRARHRVAASPCRGVPLPAGRC